MNFEDAFRQMPVIAILRGVKPTEAMAIAEAVLESGIRVIEIPLNSPDPLTSIRQVADGLAGRAVVGAGTVLSEAEVDQVVESGGRIIVSPNMNPQVIRKTKTRGLVSAPGIMTPSEAFAALAAGADVLKIFPGELFTMPIIRAVAAVLPKTSVLVLVGGVTPDAIGAFRGSPLAGFGVGSSIYKPGMTAADVKVKAAKFAGAVLRAGFGAT
ncbi:MAG TPA: 2-dehydro-3-deoxy-6-phosphogalactonate aldolase [Aestuariivirgaceae bacterium]|nr:2-dehydro-3-deoxy-6-phosphogalactonate aldolase [Aestuariivirgaceae bacterium]